MEMTMTLRSSSRPLTRKFWHASACVATLSVLLGAPVARADLLDLATAPLADSTPTTVLPNLLFLMDDSGSMKQHYTPDYLMEYQITNNSWTNNSYWFNPDTLEKNCKDSADDNPSGESYGTVSSDMTKMDMCVVGDVPYMTSAINAQYYHPEIRYLPGIQYDGSSYPSQTTPTAVSSDGYGIIKNTMTSGTTPNTINITTEFPDRVWCKVKNPSSSQLSNTDYCRKNSDYLYPNSTYKYGRYGTSYSNNNDVIGTYGAPYYYSVVVSEYCTAPDLKVCTSSATATGEYTYPAKSRWCSDTGLTNCQALKTNTYRYPRYVNYQFTRTDIVPTNNSYPKSSDRTDCAGATCTYQEEITNFSNWYSYYRTRNQSMKSAASRAFQSIGSNFRVGYMTINDQNFLKIDKFDNTTGHREAWFNKLFAANTPNSTPLRQAVSSAGKIFAGKYKTDPMQYSCQQNFLLMTTDGYWNGNAGTKINGAAMTDQDGAGTDKPKYQGYASETNASNIGVADAAKYYFDTDLRQTAFDNCTSPSTGLDVCNDDKGEQKMTTFTLGLGVDGELQYAKNYASNSADYQAVVAGTKNWPKPVTESAAAIDDLWHAAVNGGGIYFSAKSPSELVTALTDALSDIESQVGYGTATTATSPDPTAGDTVGFVSNYTPVAWTGNLLAYPIGASGDKDATPLWCVESNTDPACTGTMASLVGSVADTRKIYMNDGSNDFEDFVTTKFSAAQLALFNTTLLSQWSILDTDQKANATAENLINFLRGQTGYEMQSSNDSTKQVFRDRAATLGDIVNSKPAFISKPVYSYTDTGYDTFKSDNASRHGMVYVGANDGMLHAFSTKTGEAGKEKWAYVPTVVMPNLWKLADKYYKSSHAFFVDGTPLIADVYDADSSAWKTILVGGLNAGGRSFYAIDITTPESPSLLWEITNDTSGFAELGYSYGTPVVTKRTDGTWVVLLTSGYNNTSAGTNSGKGILYVVNATTGSLVSKHVTPAGSDATPSGLAQVTNWVEQPTADNTAVYTYGGDLLGNLWRFDINTDNSEPLKLATLLDASGTPQPITTRPELGRINGQRIVFVGTGKYLEVSDIEDTSQNSVYAIKDVGDTLTNARDWLTNVDSLSTACVTAFQAGHDDCVQSINWSSGYGWYFDLSAPGYRINVNLALDSGYLAGAANLPTDEPCTTGGKSEQFLLNYKNGSLVDYNLSNSLTTGVYFQHTSAGGVKGVFAQSTGQEHKTNELPTGALSGFSATRITWREWIPEE